MRGVHGVVPFLLLAGCGVDDHFSELSALHPHGVYLYLPDVESGVSKLLRLDMEEAEHVVNFGGDINVPMVGPEGSWLASLNDRAEVRIGVVGWESETATVRTVCPGRQFLNSAWLTQKGLYASCRELFDPPAPLLLDGVRAPQQCPTGEAVVAIGPAGHVLCESAAIAPSGVASMFSSPIAAPSAAWRTGEGWVVIGYAGEDDPAAIPLWMVTDEGGVQVHSPVPALPGVGLSTRFLVGRGRGFVGRAPDGRFFFMVTAPGDNHAKEIWSYTPGDAGAVRLDSVQHRFQNTDHVRILSGL